MKASGMVAITLAATVLFAALAQAQPPSSIWVAPPHRVLWGLWPKDSSGRLVYGAIKLNCAVGGDTKPTDCMMQSTTPDRSELAEAALRLACLFSAAPGQNGRAELLIRMDVDTLPGFVHTPNGDDMALVYPQDAMQKRHGGVATLHCWIKTTGRLRDCEIKDETPPGKGFGSAALKLAPIIMMKPATREGMAVETEVTMPMKFTPPA